MKPSEVLRAARKLIERPEDWVQGTMAVTAKGKRVVPTHEHACRFCMVGSIRRVTGSEMLDSALAFLGEATGTQMLGDWNDSERTEHHQVIDAFDRAIALAEAEESPASELERGRE